MERRESGKHKDRHRTSGEGTTRSDSAEEPARRAQQGQTAEDSVGKSDLLLTQSSF